MLRRTLLTTAFGAPALFGAKRLDWSRLSLLTDEIAKSPADAIAFCKQYGVKWVELRGVPGGGGTYAFLDEPKLREAAKELSDAGLQVSFLNTPMLKFGLPGTEPVRRRSDTAEQKAKRLEREKEQFDQRLEYLQKAIRAAHIFKVRDVRVFTFSRVEDPAALFPKLAPVLDEMVGIAEKAGVRLLVENEASCNVATAAELKQICDLVKRKGFGINWDPVNALPLKETAWPDGYRALPIERVHNVQMKARGLAVGPEVVDWKSIFEALSKDGYPGKVGLETHIFDGTLIEKAHLSMQKLKELLG